MTGPEHYRAAERHVEWASKSGQPDESVHLAYASAHATLALAAATALPHLHDTTAWQEVAQ